MLAMLALIAVAIWFDQAHCAKFARGGGGSQDGVRWGKKGYPPPI